jgi:hypothetical protein
MTPETLLKGPRGRGWCLAVIAYPWTEDGSSERTADAADAMFRLDDAMDPDGGHSRFFAFENESGKPLSGLAARRARRQILKEMVKDKADPSRLLTRLVAGIEATPVPTSTRSELVDYLAGQVDSARYWQQPEGTDFAAATPGVRKALRRVAQHLTPLCTWMDDPLEREQTWTTSGFQQGEPELTGIAAGLREARAQVREAERHHRCPKNPGKEASSDWWSILGHPPASTGLTGSDHHPGPLRLYCEEDGYRDSDEEILTRRLEVKDTERILEIRGAQDWAALCSEFPLSVSKLRRGNWWMATGRDSLAPDDGTDPGWVIPDLAAAAEDFDGIHLTVAAYLECSGTTIPVEPSHGRPNGASVVAGWNPDETVWLSDRTILQTQRWRMGDDELEPGYVRMD